MENSEISEKVVSIVVCVLLGLTFLSLVMGQAVRFALPGQGGGLIASDIACSLFVIIGSGLVLLRGTQVGLRSSLRGFLIVAPFLIWGLSVLIGRSDSIGLVNVGVALLYWARLASILLIYPIMVAIWGSVRVKRYTKRVFVGTYVVLLLLGFLQLWVLPNLEGLAGGWDPHNQRMVATWLDPNFFGAYLAIGLPFALVYFPVLNEKRRIVVRVAVLVIAIVAILLTKSRSTYIASLFTLFLCMGIWLLSSRISVKWKNIMIPGVITLCIIAGSIIFLLQERATNVFMYDPTIALRLEAYGAVWERIVSPNIVFGVGYNAYQFAARDTGLISDFLIHSRSGSDSSVITLLATTGVIGAALFFVPLLLGCFWHFRRWVLYRKYESLMFIGVTLFLLMHSQFENSLLYPHVLITYIFIAILAL